VFQATPFSAVTAPGNRLGCNLQISNVHQQAVFECKEIIENDKSLFPYYEITTTTAALSVIKTYFNLFSLTPKATVCITDTRCPYSLKSCSSFSMFLEYCIPVFLSNDINIITS